MGKDVGCDDLNTVGGFRFFVFSCEGFCFVVEGLVGEVNG